MSEDLPPGWVSASLGVLATEVRNGISQRPDEAGGQPILRISAVRHRALDTADTRFLPSSPEWERYRLREGDLLFTRYNGNADLVGACAMVRQQPSEPLVYPDKLIRVRVDPNVVESSFLEAVMSTARVRDLIRQQVKTSAGQAGISGSDLKEIHVPLAPLNEQRRIVAKLEDLLARSRRAKQALDAIPPLLETLRRSILAAAFRGDLTADWRAQHPEVEPADRLLARIRTERRKKWEQAELAKLRARGKAPSDERWKEKYREPAPAEETDVLAVPESWAWASLDELCSIVGGITKGQRRAEGTKTRLVSYLRVANVQRGHLDLSEVRKIEATESEIDDLKLLNGDILLNEGGDRDKLGRGWIWHGELEECIHQNHVFRARPVVRDLESQFVSHYANTFGQTFFLDAGKQTTNLASVSMSKVRTLPVPLPPADEQVAIVRRLSAELAKLAALEGLVSTSREQLNTLDSAGLAKAFRGELVAQDPTDEPADGFLARLQGAEPAPERPSGVRKKRGKKSAA